MHARFRSHGSSLQYLRGAGRGKNPLWSHRGGLASLYVILNFLDLSNLSIYFITLPFLIHSCCCRFGIRKGRSGRSGTGFVVVRKRGFWCGLAQGEQKMGDKTNPIQRARGPNALTAVAMSRPVPAARAGLQVCRSAGGLLAYGSVPRGRRTAPPTPPALGCCGWPR